MKEATMPVGEHGQQPKVPRSIFITGANGFIGRALMDRYLALGCEVRGMDIQADADRNVVAGDLSQPAAWTKHADGCELFIHTAAVVSLAADWQRYREVTLMGTRHALDVSIVAGAKRFVHFSSIAAMGYDYPIMADETAPIVIGEEYRYGVAKGASEHVVLAAHAAGEMACTIIRPGDVYGPGSRAWLIEPLKMAKAGRLVLPNKGEGIFTPVYIEDLLDGVMLAAGLDQGSGQIFILWGNESVLCKDFFEHHWRWAKRKTPVPSMPLKVALQITGAIWKLNQLFRRNDEITPDAMLMFSRRGGYNSDKAKTLLGYSPKIDIKEGMKCSEQWLRKIGELD
jgi:nucleoside-diphosphate-sugar epimerase